LRKHSIEAVQLVRESLDLATRDPDLSPDGAADAMGVCRVLLELSVDRYGQRGKAVLIDWGIVSSDDVGLIMGRLIDAGAVRQFADRPLDDFDRLFDLRESPESWQLRW
jgi:uncharacterized repeat protein (TIGR04138 family)